MFQGQRTLDELNRTLLITGLACAILAALLFQNIPWLRTVLSATASVCLIVTVFRLLAGNREQRYRENQRFLTGVTAIKGWFAGAFAHKSGERQPRAKRTPRAYRARKNPTWAEIRQYKYFICPQCTQRLRVPRGKGKLRVTCTRCGNVFETKS